MSSDSEAGWDVVWPAIQSDEDFGKELMLDSALHMGRGTTTRILCQRLRESQLADFYIWLGQRFPHSDDPVNEAAHYVGSREGVAELRDGLLQHLQACGTPEELQAIRRILTELPHLGWMSWVQVDARTQMLRHTWVPSDIHVDAVARNPRERQLQRITVIIEVKGCWNRELDTAMEVQLRDRYMREGNCRHGVYLAAWFNPEKWDATDNRRRTRLTIDQARTQFRAQAAALSINGVLLRPVILDASLP